jgi:prephenate dehydratase
MDSNAAAVRQGFNYLFYIDFVGPLSDPNCQNALRHLQVKIALHHHHNIVYCASGIL